MDLTFAQELLQQWGYLIIVGWTFIEGETIVIVAGYIAQSGFVNLNPWLIALAAFCGTFASDQLMFCLGKYKGASILKRFPRLDKNTDKARRLLVKYETALILGFRFVYGIRNVTPILLGISGVRHIKFVALNFIGASVWAISFSFGGYYFGEFLERVSSEYPHMKYIILGVVISLILSVIIIRKVRSRKHVKNHKRIVAEGNSRDDSHIEDKAEITVQIRHDASKYATPKNENKDSTDTTDKKDI